MRVFDGFAGPGVYSGGESGSPLILMRALCTNRQSANAMGARPTTNFGSSRRTRCAPDVEGEARGVRGCDARRSRLVRTSRLEL